jgi:DNA-binding MarR family transcriptional regulator
LTDRMPSDADFIETMPVILRAFRALTAEADERLDSLGLGRAHFRALGVIALEPGVTVSEVIATLGITIQAINRIMVDLQMRALVRAELDAGDRRRRKLFVTDEGQRIFEEVMADQTAVLRRATEACGIKGFEAYRAFLEVMAEVASPPNRR